MFSFGILDDETTEIPLPASITGILLDDRHTSKSALRAPDVLEFFALRQQPARAAEVAHTLGLSTSTTDQLLKTMVSRAYLLFDFQSKLYRPSPRLLGFAVLLQRTFFGGDSLRMLMSDLRKRSGCSVTLSTPFGRMMQVVDYDFPAGLSYLSAPGYLFPLFSSAAGSAILATWPSMTVRDMIAQSEDQLGPLSQQPDIILERLDEARVNGHAFGGLSNDVETCSIAVALPRTKSGSELVVSVRGQIDDLKIRRWRLAAMMEEIVNLHLRPALGLH